jgi:molybdopterin-guanine dinucleotide biosynthesis protein A
MTRLGGIVLAGGRSTRMGVDKAHVDWHGTPLVAHVAALVRDAVDGPVVVVGSPERPLPRLPDGVELVEDAVVDRGPLQGLHDGLTALTGRADVALATGVDAPLLRPEAIRLLAAALERSGAQAAVPCLASDRRPLPAVYRVELAATTQRLLDADERRLRALVEAVTVVAVPEDELRLVDPRLGSLAPLNTPDELEAALRAANGL